MVGALSCSVPIVTAKSVKVPVIITRNKETRKLLAGMVKHTSNRQRCALHPKNSIRNKQPVK